MNKHRSFKLIFIGFLLILGIFGCSNESANNTPSNSSRETSTSTDDNDSANDEKIVFRTGSALPENQIWMESHLKPWMERVEEETNGRVEFELYAGGSLIGMGEEYDALKSGTVDIALPMLHLYDLQRFSLSEVTMLPTTKSDAEIVSTAFRNLLYDEEPFSDGETYYEKEFGSRGLYMWPIGMGQPYSLGLVSKKVETVDDLKGLTLRTPGRITEYFTKNLGSTSVTMTQADTFDAMSRGAVDGTYDTVGDRISFGNHELIKFTILGANLGHYNTVFGMTQEKWDSLPDDIKEIMETAALETQASEHNVNTMYEWEENVMKISKEEFGAEFVRLEDLDPEVQEYISDAMTKTWLDWIEQVEADGFPGKEMAIKWRDHLIAAGGEVPQGVMEIE